ncbi:MAG: AraC family transcriptional regulator [Burkholderiales bacterium]|nr:AraC family transcriptional regulator [Burkholderiales bacterium]
MRPEPLAPDPAPPAPAAPIDRLSPLLERFRVRARLFHAGPLCGTTRFTDDPGHGFLHVMRRGEMRVTHRPRSGAPRTLQVREPSLLFYPRPLAHDFHHALAEGCDFTCATLAFEGGPRHPLVAALPPLVCLPLAALPGLAATLDLLFAETAALRCGSRLLADRLFEVVLIQLLRWLLDHPHEAGLHAGLLQGLSDPRLAHALTALHERPGEPWGLADMAAAAGMSRSAFAAAFRHTVGTTPAAYLADWRLTLAQARLREGQPVKKIASELGYANASALSRLFSQRLAASPRQWLASEAHEKGGRSPLA